MSGENARPGRDLAAAPALTEVRLSDIAHGGEAVGREDSGRVIFASFGLPGELVEVAIRKQRRTLAHGDVVRVVESAAERVAPACPYFTECGGCAWQHAAYPAQVAWKAGMVESMLRRAGLDTEGRLTVIAMDDPWRYRIRGELQVLYTVGGPAAGFYRHGSWHRLAVDDCLIHHERIGAAIPAIASALRGTNLQGVDNIQLTVEPGGSGLLYRVRFREKREQSLPPRFLDLLSEALPGVALTDDSIGLDIEGLHFRVRSETFVQSNYRGMLRLYARTMELLCPEPGMRVWEGYGGIGTLGSMAARAGAEVRVFEENPYSVHLGRHNAAINRLTLDFKVSQVEDALARERGPVDAVLLDPPRAGLGPAVVAALSRLRPARVVYISCEPSTLARDLEGLVRAGYRLEGGSVVDMFPHTAHVETVLALGLN